MYFYGTLLISARLKKLLYQSQGELSVLTMEKRISDGRMPSRPSKGHMKELDVLGLGLAVGFWQLVGSFLGGEGSVLLT